MKIDTNLKIDKRAIKNLEVDRQSILRPNTQEIPLSKEVPNKNAAMTIDWDAVMKDLLNSALKNKQKNSQNEKQALNITNDLFSIPSVSNTKQTLTESIRYCLLHKTIAELEYNGGKRTVEIYCWGKNTSDNDVIRVFQVDGYSESGNPSGFKTFLVSKILNFQIRYNEKFLIRRGYKKYDEEMKKIYLQL